MNKEMFQDWKNNPITKEIFSRIKETVKEVQTRSKVKSTADKTAMQCAADEGFCDGVDVFAEIVDDIRLEMEGE